MLQERLQNGMTAALQSSEIIFPFLAWLGTHCSNVFFHHRFQEASLRYCLLLLEETQKVNLLEQEAHITLFGRNKYMFYTYLSLCGHQTFLTVVVWSVLQSFRVLGKEWGQERIELG